MNTTKIGQTFEPIVDVIISILYLAGIAVIELWLRPLFGSKGVPSFANIVLSIFDAILIISLLIRLVITVDNLWRAVKGTTLYQNIGEVITSRRDKIANKSVGPKKK